jgi:hypothetical protein
MTGDRITANLPSRDFSATSALFATGIAPARRVGGWMILTRRPLGLAFDPWPDHGRLMSAGRTAGPACPPRLTGIVKHPGGLHVFALVDGEGAPPCIPENGGPDVRRSA